MPFTAEHGIGNHVDMEFEIGNGMTDKEGSTKHNPAIYNR
jgi:hypothetical protein